MIGATADAIDKAEDRSRFDKAMKSIGLECPRADAAKTMEEAYRVLDMVGFHHHPTLIYNGSTGEALRTIKKSLKKFVVAD